MSESVVVDAKIAYADFGTETNRKMFLRLIQSTLVGMAFASCLAVLFLAGLWTYIEFFWVPAHPGLGAVAGGIYPLLWLTPVAFIVGFVWKWRRLQKR